MYRATFNSSAFICHFNGNHSSKSGQFTSGDGDKDGVVDDHHNYARNKNKGMKGTGPAKPVAKSSASGSSNKSNSSAKTTTPRKRKKKSQSDLIYEAQMRRVDENIKYTKVGLKVTGAILGTIGALTLADFMRN